MSGVSGAVETLRQCKWLVLNTGKLINRTYGLTHFDSLSTRQEQEVARIEAQLHKAKLELIALNTVRDPA